VFGLTKLTALSLGKHAHVFLGESPLGDAVLTAAAASLTHLARLDLAVVAASDAGFASLASLAGLTHLSLRGQLAVSLKSLATVFSATTRLQTLELHGLLASSRDVRGIAAAHSSSSGTTTTVSTSGRDRSQPGTAASSSWASSRLWQQQQAEGAASPASAGSSCGRRTSMSSSIGSIGNGRGAGRPAGAAARGRHRGGSSSSRSRGWGADWSAVLLPLRRLATLKLQSDLALLGSCAALRSMSHVTDVELHGAATFLPGNGAALAGLPPSWLAQLAQDAASGAEEPAASERVWASSSMAAGTAARAGGAWPALASLHVDDLLLADGFVGAVAQLANLKTLIVSGACLLAVPAAQAGGQQQQQQPQQQGPGWRSACPGLAGLPGLQQLSPAGVGSNGSSSSTTPTAGAWDGWQQQPQHKPGDKQQAAAAALAAALKLAAAQPLESSSNSTSSLLGSSGSSTTTSSRSNSGHSLGPQQRYNTSGMHAPQLLPVAPVLQPQQFRPLLDVDVLTQLSPLSRLGKFELHLPQQQQQPLQGEWACSSCEQAPLGCILLQTAALITLRTLLVNVACHPQACG
jgi:hypothetical protein